jgi:hypothetical protein
VVADDFLFIDSAVFHLTRAQRFVKSLRLSTYVKNRIAASRNAGDHPLKATLVLHPVDLQAICFLKLRF